MNLSPEYIVQVSLDGRVWFVKQRGELGMLAYYLNRDEAVSHRDRLNAANGR
jgi:hypothetical protein